MSKAGQSTKIYFGTESRKEGDLMEGVLRLQWMLDPSHHICLEEGWTVLVELTLSPILS